jgi:hypothetical protein
LAEQVVVEVTAVRELDAMTVVSPRFFQIKEVSCTAVVRASHRALRHLTHRSGRPMLADALPDGDQAIAEPLGFHSAY